MNNCTMTIVKMYIFSNKVKLNQTYIFYTAMVKTLVIEDLQPMSYRKDVPAVKEHAHGMIRCFVETIFLHLTD